MYGTRVLVHMYSMWHSHCRQYRDIIHSGWRSINHEMQQIRRYDKKIRTARSSLIDNSFIDSFTRSDALLIAVASEIDDHFSVLTHGNLPAHKPTPSHFFKSQTLNTGLKPATRRAHNIKSVGRSRIRIGATRAKGPQCNA